MSILTDLINAVVWTVSIIPLISNSSNVFSKAFVTVPSAPITIGITAFLMCYSLFYFSNKIKVFFFLFTFFNFFSVVNWKAKIPEFLFYTRLALLTIIRWFSCISKSQGILCVSFSVMDSALCIYHSFIGSNFDIMHNFKCITFSNPVIHILYFHASLLHSLIMW